MRDDLRVIAISAIILLVMWTIGSGIIDAAKILFSILGLH